MVMKNALSAENPMQEGDLVGTLTGEQSLVGVLSGECNLAGMITQGYQGGEYHEIYDGEYEVVPKPEESTVLNTSGKLMTGDVTVFEIPYFEVSNLDGKTVYIGKEITIE